MNKRMTRILALVVALVFVASLAGCSGRQTPEAGQSTPTPPVTTTVPALSGHAAEEVLSIGPARVFFSDFLYFHGDASLPDGTILESQLYESGKSVPWWPADQSITVDNGTWEVKVPLGINGAPARLKRGPGYLFKVWQGADPSMQAVFYFDLGGPPAAGPWWKQMFHFIGGLFDDLVHGRL